MIKYFRNKLDMISCNNNSIHILIYFYFYVCGQILMNHHMTLIFKVISCALLYLLRPTHIATSLTIINMATNSRYTK